MLPKPCKIVNHAPYMNRKYSYMKNTVIPLRQLQMRCYNRNPLLTSFHSCKREGRQHRNCFVANMLPKQLEKRSCCCDIFFNVVSMLLFSNKKTVSSAQCCHGNSGGEVLAKKAIVSSEN